MGTIEIHEPEVKQVQPGQAAKRAAGTSLPPAELILGPPLPPRAMFADSLLEFGTQNKRKSLATTSSFVFNCLLILVMLAVPLMFTEELPKAQLLTFFVAPPLRLPRLRRRPRGGESGETDSNRYAEQRRHCGRQRKFHKKFR